MKQNEEKKVVAIDLETIANKKLISILPKPKPKGTLKKPEKIAADIEAKTAKQLLEMGMNPHLNMICCAGWSDGEKTGNVFLKEENEEAEAGLLKYFWEIISQYDHFVTFNGRSFDIPCLLYHGITHGIRPGVQINHSRYNQGNHTDLRLALTNGDKYASGKLDFFLRRYVADHKTEGMDGEKVQHYWDMGLHEEIANYCMDDCEKTMKLYRALEVVGLTE